MLYNTLLKLDFIPNSEIMNVFKMLLGNQSEMIQQKEYWLLVHDQSKNEEVIQTLQSLESDVNGMFTVYQDVQDDKIRAWMEPLFLTAPQGYYSFKSLILCSTVLPKAKELLDYLLEGTGVSREVIQAMADCDMNVSKAATMLYMHRNTLLYKIDRLWTLRNLDLRCFNDLYLLVKLTKA